MNTHETNPRSMLDPSTFVHLELSLQLKIAPWRLFPDSDHGLPSSPNDFDVDRDFKNAIRSFFSRVVR